jgi:hypothetical protein
MGKENRMGTQGESFMKKTQKGLSILAFETTKQSRILKKRMRGAALQKEVKADLRDLGNLVYNALINDQPGILEEEEVKILVENIRDNKLEVEHLRDSMARLNRSRKHFEEPEVGFEAPPAPPPESRPAEAKPEAAAETPAAPLLEPEEDKPEAKPKAPRKAPAKRPAKAAAGAATQEAAKKPNEGAEPEAKEGDSGKAEAEPTTGEASK